MTDIAEGFPQPDLNFIIKGPPAPLFKAMAAAQAAFAMVERSKTVNTGTYEFKYAPLDEVLGAVLPALNANGVWFTQPLSRDDGYYTLRTMLCHESGAYIEAQVRIPEGQKSIQQLGSAITYMRRYSVQAILGVAAEEDDDGAAASELPSNKSWRKGTSESKLSRGPDFAPPGEMARPPVHVEEPSENPAPPEPQYLDGKAPIMGELATLFKALGIGKTGAASKCQEVTGALPNKLTQADAEKLKAALEADVAAKNQEPGANG